MEVVIDSNFGVDTAILLLDKSTSPEFIEPVISNIAEISVDTENPERFKAEAAFDHKVLALNTFPIYAELVSKVALTTPLEYILNIPLYYQEVGSTESIEVTMSAKFDFGEGEGDINVTLTAKESDGRDKIELKENDVLIIPIVKMGSTDPKLIMERSDNTITITAMNDTDLGLTLSLEPYAATKKYAFTLKNLLGNTEVSTYFDETGQQPAPSFRTNNPEQNKPIALINALNKPLFNK